MPKKKNKKEEKEKKDETQDKDTNDPYIGLFEDTWKEDYSDFIYSGTAVSSATSDVSFGKVFEDDKKFVEEWKEKRKEKKFCPDCKKYFPSYLSRCPHCDKKIE